MEPLEFQIVADARDPLAQARWWAAARRYEVELVTPFVERMLAEGHATEADVLTVPDDPEDPLAGQRFWATGVAIRHPSAVDDADAARRRGNRILFMRVPDPTPGKTRWHLDLAAGQDRIDGEVARLRAAGAGFVHDLTEHGHRFVTLTDPEGNHLCVH